MIRIVVHGGAGTVRGEDRRKLAEKGVIEAIEAGYEILASGGSALDAVQQAVKVMEDLPQFNAGYGSVVTEDMTIEMDAMLVDGSTGNIGGVMGISRIKNPIVLCRKIMEESDHLLFSGKGAERFAEKHGFDLIDPETLITDRIRQRFASFKEKQGKDTTDPEGRKYGTVGAVAVDSQGNVAAATSTGGTLGKQLGRIGDTPIFGAGTYADEHVAVSATGIGEYIIQGMLGMRIMHLAETHSIDEATRLALEYMTSRYGPAGVIVIDKNGEWAAQKTTQDLVYAVKDENMLKTFRSE